MACVEEQIDTIRMYNPQEFRKRIDGCFIDLEKFVALLESQGIMTRKSEETNLRRGTNIDRTKIIYELCCNGLYRLVKNEADVQRKGKGGEFQTIVSLEERGVKKFVSRRFRSWKTLSNDLRDYGHKKVDDIYLLDSGVALPLLLFEIIKYNKNEWMGNGRRK